MNLDPRKDKSSVLREYFANAYLIALLKEIGERASAIRVEAKPLSGRIPGKSAC